MSSGLFGPIKNHDDIKKYTVNNNLKPLHIQACLDAMAAMSKRAK